MMSFNTDLGCIESLSFYFQSACVPSHWHLYFTYFGIEFKIEVTFFHCEYTSYSYYKPNGQAVYLAICVDKECYFLIKNIYSYDNLN